MKRRLFLSGTIKFLAGIAVGAAAFPFIRSLLPSAKAKLRTTTVEFPKLEPGQIFAVTTPWLTTVYILHRTPQMLNELEGFPNLADPSSQDSIQPPDAKNVYRSVRPEFLVVEAACTHLGCSVSYMAPNTEEYLAEKKSFGRFFCPCHGSYYDLAGRVVNNVPAPTNLVVPNYTFIDDKIIEIEEFRRGT